MPARRYAERNTLRTKEKKELAPLFNVNFLSSFSEFRFDRWFTVGQLDAIAIHGPSLAYRVRRFGFYLG